MFRNQQEYYNKYHDETIFEKRGVVGFTSRKNHLIAVFSEPVPGAFTEPERNIKNVVFHESGHAMNNVKGEERVRLDPALIDQLRIRHMDYAVPELTWFDKVWAHKLDECGKHCPPNVSKQLNYYLNHGAGEMFAECFALAHGHGSDPQLDPLIVKYFGSLIELLKGPTYE